jgi:hypothetical protein
MKILDHVSQNMPERPNEDRLFMTPHSFGVMDGATALDPTRKGDLQVCMNILQDVFSKNCDAEGAEPVRLVKRATAALQAKFDPNDDPVLMPCSTMAYVHTKDGVVTIAQLGDSSVLVCSVDGQYHFYAGDPMAAKGDAANIKRMVEKRKSNPGISIDKLRDLILYDIKVHRRRSNAPDGNGVLAPREGAERHLIVHKFSAKDIKSILVMTDGFSALVDTFHAYHWPDLMNAASKKGLKALVMELRAMQDKDPLGVQYPRFKHGDDATAILAVFP